MSEKVEGDISATAETGDSDMEGLATPISIGNLHIVENQEGNDALNLDIKSEEINKIEFKSSQVIPGNTNRELNDTNTETEDVTTESPEIEPSSDGETMGGSEEMLNKPCQPCLENNKHIDSVLYCIECEDYLCEKCVEMHRGVKLSKSHKLVPKEMPDKHGNEMTIHKKEECPIHLNEFIEWFCIADDKLCCPICKATEHSKCQSLVAVTSAAATTERKTIEQAITETQTQLKSAIDKKRTDIKLLEEDKYDSLRVLEDIKTDTENTFQSLRCSLDKENRKIEAMYIERNKHLKTDVENYSKVVKNLDATLTMLQKENICDEYKFIQMKKAEIQLRTVQGTVLHDTSEPLSTPKGFERDKLYDQKLNAFDRFGYFDAEKSLYKCAALTKINVLQRKEKKSLVFDICVSGCDTILITDWTNRAIKLVDIHKGSIEGKLNLQTNPFGICKLAEEGMYAATLTNRKRVLVIEVGKYGTVVEKTSFETGEYCRGIAHNNFRLFVACGGRKDEGPGHIRIFDMDGKLQKTIMSDEFGYARICCPWKVEHLPGKEVVLVTDSCTKNLTQIDSSDNVIKLVTGVPLCSSLASLCSDPEGRIVIGDRVSKSIKLVSSDYRQVQTIVADLPERPVAIAFDNSNLKLFVALENIDDLFCFHVEMNNWDKRPTFC